MDYKEIGTQLGSTVIDFIKLTGIDDQSEQRLENIYNSQLPQLLSTINLQTLNAQSLNRIVEGMVNYFIEDNETTDFVIDQMKDIMGGNNANIVSH